MATDARISTALPSHPKTKKLVRQLGPEAGWSLVCLILWAASNRSDGDLSGLSDEDVELASDWDGAPGAFVAALRATRFVDGGEGQSYIHDWTEHQPWAAGSEARSLKAKWNAVKRYHGEDAADNQVPEYAAIRHATSTTTVQDQHASSTKVLNEQHADSIQGACSISFPNPLHILSESFPIPTPTYSSGGVADAPPPAEDKPVKVRRHRKPHGEPAVSSQVWASYANAYRGRYGAEPVRNAKVNGQLAQFVARIGADESPGVAAFFVGHQSAFYVRAMHPVDMLLRDAEPLRTQWATQRQVTTTQAMQADRTQTNLNAFGPLIAEARARESKGETNAQLNAA